MHLSKMVILKSNILVQILACCFLFGLAVPSEGKDKYSPNALIILKTETIEEMQRAIEEIKVYGGQIDHIFPPKGLIGYLPPEASDYFRILPSVFSIEYDVADERGLGQLGESAGIAAHVWNTVFCGLPAAASTTVIKGVPQTPGNDALVAPDLELLWQRGEESISNVPGFSETSEFFVGSVVVGIITPESSGAIDPNSENWDSARQSTVVAKITEGLQWWKDNSQAPSDMSFVYDIHHSVSTGYEPISRTFGGVSSDEGLWIGEVMKNLGYPSSGGYYPYFTQVREYLKEKRNTFNTDWAFAVFVVDSLNDADGSFLDDARGARAYLNGPLMVMSYDINGWGIGRMQMIMAHETGHIWGALDEYAISGCNDTDTGGYLNIANTNCENGDLPTEDSIMRDGYNQEYVAYPSHHVSTPVRQMVGWRDSDGDGKEKYDPVDTTPAVSLTPFSPDPTDDSTPTFTGSAQDVPYDSPTHTDVTINIISKVEWQVAGGAWQNATATDGKFDSYNESFTFTAGPLTGGTYLFEVRATNSVGNTSSIAQDTLNVKLNTSPIANAGPDQIVITGSQVIIDGSKSYDPEGNLSVYQWSFVSIPPGSSAKISLPTTIKPIFTPDKDGTYIVQLDVNDGKLVSKADTVKITSLGLTQHILISTNQSSYASGDTLELFICLGNSKTNPDIKADIFLGFVKPDDSLVFFDSSLSKLVGADPNDLSTFTPCKIDVTIPSGFVSPTPKEANADMDKDGVKEVFRFFSAQLPSSLKEGTYYAFAVLAKPGSYQWGIKELIGDVSIVKFSFSP